MSQRAGTIIAMDDAKRVVRPAAPSKSAAVLLFSVLLFAVLAFGAVEPWAMYALEVLASLLCAAQLGRIFRASATWVPHPLYPALLWMALVVIVQMIFSTSVYGWITASQLKGLIALEMLFFVTAQVLTEYRITQLFFFLLTGSGFAIAVFALVQRSLGNGKIYWIRNLQYNGMFFGPYVNKNHYAGLMEMLFPIPLFLAFTTKDVEKRALLSFLSVVMAGSIFISNSRGGMIACIVQLVVTITLFSASSRRRRGWIWGAGLVLAMVVMVGWLNDRQVVDRLLTLREPLAEDTAGNRLEIVRDSLPIIRHHLWMGTGLGTFPHIYPTYRSFYSESFVNAGHNDYLQLIVETGLFGTFALLWFAWVYLRNLRSLLRTWHLLPFSTLQMAATVSCLGLLVHSVVDFNLHIPANAALFFVLLAISTRDRGNKDVDGGPTPHKIRSM